jgi:hypothetical protein
MKGIAVLLLLCSLLFSCKRKWTQEDKSEFLGGCIKTAITDLGEERAKPYCSCLLNKMLERYPNANDMKYAKYDSSIVGIAKDCLKQH